MTSLLIPALLLVIKMVLISSVCIHTNDCKKHSLFVAQVGIHYDGHDFITKAIEMGASAVVLPQLLRLLLMELPI